MSWAQRMENSEPHGPRQKNRTNISLPAMLPSRKLRTSRTPSAFSTVLSLSPRSTPGGTR